MWEFKRICHICAADCLDLLDTQCLGSGRRDKSVTKQAHGALAYGELAAMMPQAGGQYVFLREAYGGVLAFCFGWTLLLVIQAGAMSRPILERLGFVEVTRVRVLLDRFE